MAIPDIQRALAARGFKLDDAFYHPCEACSERAVARYTVHGKLAGRQIDLCLACGVARSWRQAGGNEDRTLDPGFDIATFLA